MVRFLIAALLASYAHAEETSCVIEGDPHIRMFMNKAGWQHHPVYTDGKAPWWLVKTSGDFLAQATYSQCGRRVGGGWQGARAHGTSPHCLHGVAFGGKVLDNMPLTIFPPCRWNWYNMSCDSCTEDSMPIVMWKGQRLECTHGGSCENTPAGVSIRSWKHKLIVEISGGKATAHLGFMGGAGFEPTAEKTCTGPSHSFLKLQQTIDSFGEQCGHCGTHDPETSVRGLYEWHGQGNLVESKVKELGLSKRLCDPVVKASDSFFPEELITKNHYESPGVLLQAEADDPHVADADDDCPKGLYNKSRAICITRFEADSPHDQDWEDFLEACIQDVCMTGDKTMADMDEEENVAEHEPS